MYIRTERLVYYCTRKKFVNRFINLKILWRSEWPLILSTTTIFLYVQLYFRHLEILKDKIIVALNIWIVETWKPQYFSVSEGGLSIEKEILSGYPIFARLHSHD